MATISLLKANPFPLLLSQRRQNFRGNLCCMKSAKLSTSFRFPSVKVKSFNNLSPNSTAVPLSFETRSISLGSNENPSENDVLNTIFKTLKWLKVSAVVTVHSLLLIMMMYGGDSALARSGGVMGGHSFKSSSSSSTSSRSSHSSSSKSSGSSSRTSSSSSSSPSYSSSSSSSRPSYSSSSSSSRPSYSSSSSSPTSSSSSSSLPSSTWTSSLSSSTQRSYSSPSSSTKSSQPSWTTVASQSTEQPASPSSVDNDYLALNFMLWCLISIIAWYVILGTLTAIRRFLSRTSVIKLQLGLLVTDQSLQRDLNQIAETADTSNSHGWIDILNRTTDSLLRHYGYCISHYSAVELQRNLEDAEACFKQLSMDERAKFDEETLVNLNNVKEEKVIGQKANDQFIYTYMVVTILLSASGTIKLPIIKDKEDLKNVLKMLRSIHSSGEIQAVNVIWTPQEEDEIMSVEELNQDYPHLRPLNG